MKKLAATIMTAALILLLAACSPKPIDITAITVTADGADAASSIMFEVEKSVNIGVTLPSDKMTYSLAASDGLTISENNGAVSITSQKPGGYILTVNLEGEGYEPAVLDIPVTVKPHPLEIGVSSTDESAISGDNVTLSRGDTLELQLDTPEGTSFEAASQNSDVATCGIEGGKLVINGIYPGTATITIDASKPNYEPAKKTLNITVEPSDARLALQQNAISIVAGTTAQTTVSYEQSGKLSLSYDNTALSVRTNGATLIIDGIKTGNHKITISCEAQGYKTVSADLTVTVLPPKTVIEAPGSISLRNGETQNITIRKAPADANITVTATGAVSAVLKGDSVVVTGINTGIGQITVTAQKDGYQSTTAIINAEVRAQLPSADTTSYAATVNRVIELTNAERAAAGLSPLAHNTTLDVFAAVRAKEAARSWSHTRPDGRAFETILKDNGFSYRSAGENLWNSNILDEQRCISDFMNSPSHRENLMRPEFNSIGIGVYYENGEYFIAQIYANS